MADRIKEIASLIPDGAIIADIGTDHAYLIVELSKINNLKFGYAIDNKDGPIANAKKTIAKYHLNDKCEIIKADGLSFSLDKSIDTLVFAGMGGMNIIEIISKDISKLNYIKYIIIDAHKNELQAIEYLKSINYRIDIEKNIIDKKRNYHLIRFIK